MGFQEHLAIDLDGRALLRLDARARARAAVPHGTRDRATALQASIVVHCATRPSFVSDKMIATAASVVNACQTQTGVTTADIESVRNGQWPDSMELKCYMYCLWEQFGLIDEKRELSLNGMLTFFQRIPAYRKEVQQAISECKALGQYFASADSCEYAYTFNKCYADRSPRTYYLF
ncbi:general odorant-binding protein 69a-like isoform X2 [Phymastichus coffea]|uniref:general odorant-binding protein 69a-like isoform X2 n=1 Tax=Phymastichus coffea TaxID=108790 RepID=UPI00273BDB34|nr:general odorant-binding protein 69a-like isoform X2 [Phymastichus coffea]